ncbi:MAG TPA: hypothetical protein VGN16_15125 [Acidobacteriaceae bacterium]|jgi:hypothetical protein
MSLRYGIDPTTYLRRETYLERIVAYDCSKCGAVNLDPLDSQKFIVHGEPVCLDCAVQCEHCGEWIDDSTIGLSGPQVVYRQPENDGRFSSPCHALCAAGHLLGLWAGDRFFDPEVESRERIEEVVRGRDQERQRSENRD